MSICADCRFYNHEVEHEGQKYGLCFRYPPVALAENRSAAPIVRREKIACGEFKPKPKKRARVKNRGRK
ncbi:hypothetical protein M2222_008289 [Bradyrhizobium elkanii]|nr:hypothetical protein [Bradyrhizobium elkanii]MCS3565967.1 hypothetical protein [Bradyrhizobium elkanii]MCW2153303.1 hypothetical protein [Bradyrhizobium elkanii]MCW2377036.1 hypothetical protein [Bradyrhizobium elkanii]